MQKLHFLNSTELVTLFCFILYYSIVVNVCMWPLEYVRLSLARQLTVGALILIFNIEDQHNICDMSL